MAERQLGSFGCLKDGFAIFLADAEPDFADIPWDVNVFTIGPFVECFTGLSVALWKRDKSAQWSGPGRASLLAGLARVVQ